MKEGIEIVSLYMAAPRPTVERDGLLLMVDDERFPLAPGEEPADALDPLPHARLLPADRRGRERGGDAARGRAGNAPHHHQRAPGPRDRQGRRRRGMEKKKQQGYF
jgi:sulfate adenylyltransferase subunit 2